MTEEEKKERLLNLIDDLCKPSFAKDTKLIESWIQNLNVIYANEYRHTYSDIFFKVQSIISVSDSEVLEILGENLNVLYAEINKKHDENPADANLKNTIFSYKKFADHINLEIGRFNFIKSQIPKLSENNTVGQTTVPATQPDEELVAKVDKLETAVNNIRPIATKAQSELDKLDSKLESNKISSITTLTIFSAVVLAFSGGITFEAGMLEGMAAASPYRLVFTIALTGFILFNTIFALLYMVGKMAGKSLNGKCKYWCENKYNDTAHITCDGGSCTKRTPTPGLICKMLYKHTFVTIVDIVLIIVMYLDFFLWLFKDNLCSLPFLIAVIAPFAVLMIIITFCLTKSRAMKKRILLKNKIDIIRRLLVLDTDTEITWTSVISRALLKMTGAKSDTEKLTEKLKELGYKEAIKAVDAFVQNQYETEEKVYTKVTRIEHKLNKKKWKSLKGKFKTFVENQK